MILLYYNNNLVAISIALIDIVAIVIGITGLTFNNYCRSCLVGCFEVVSLQGQISIHLFINDFLPRSDLECNCSHVTVAEEGVQD